MDTMYKLRVCEQLSIIFLLFTEKSSLIVESGSKIKTREEHPRERKKGGGGGGCGGLLISEEITSAAKNNR